MLFYETGGYPLCVQNYIKSLINGKETSQNKCLNGAISNFPISIPPEVVFLFTKGNLSIYRYIDRKILSKINTFVTETNNLLSILLTEAGYKEYYFQGIAYDIHSKEIFTDSLLRRVYSIKYRTEKPERFIAACDNAAKTYLNFLINNHKGEDFLPLWLIEYWYQLLQSRQAKYKNSITNLGETRGLTNDEITNGLKLLHRHSDKKNKITLKILQAKIERDWELKFLLCYNSYHKSYDPSNFKKFQKNIRYECEKVQINNEHKKRS